MCGKHCRVAVVEVVLGKRAAPPVQGHNRGGRPVIGLSQKPHQHAAFGCRERHLVDRKFLPREEHRHQTKRQGGGCAQLWHAASHAEDIPH
jgi:hypothetical protein